MRMLLVALIFTLIVLIPSGGTDYASMPSGPHLIVSSFNGTLEIDRPGTIWFDIRNDANSSAVGQNATDQRFPVWLQPGYGTNISDAVDVSIELIPKGSRFEMLTGPQLAGSLESGENRTVGFNLRTDDMTVPGVYPVDLLVKYHRLADVKTSGDPEQPDVTFQYANVSETIPEEVNVVQGTRILVEEVKDGALTGKESEINLILANSGDLPATDLRAKILHQPPFSSGGGPLLLGNLDPGHSVSSKFTIKTENGTVPGIYALQIEIDYRDNNTLRKEELAAILPVKSPAETESMLVPAAGTLVLVSAAYVVLRTYKRRGRRKRKRRW